MTPSDQDLGFAPEWDQPIRYIARTHQWYGTLGYGNPYRYAQYTDVPFCVLPRLLTQSRVALLTTAAPYQADKGDQNVRSPYNAAAKFFRVYSGDCALDHDLRISHVGIDRQHAVNDANTWFPLPALRRAAATGRIGEISPRFVGVPTNRSQRHTLEIDCAEVLALCREDRVDCAVLVANCPVCHQTMSLTARHLEENGIPTVILGAAKDIVELCGVPRFLFSDFPLGNAAGRPFDAASCDATLELAFKLLERAVAPRTTVQNPLRWNGAPEWRLDYMNVERLGADEVARRRAENDRIKEVAQGVRDGTLVSA